MRRYLRRGALAAGVALLAASPALAQESQAPAAPRPAGAGIPIGEITWVDRGIERAELPEKSSWQRLAAGGRVRTGDTFRTADDATARLDFPWMSVTLGGSTMLTIPASTVLSTLLEQGRAEFSGPGRDIVKLNVGEAEVRGGGRLVVRRSVGRTAVAALEGGFRVRAKGRTVEIEAGQGTVVADGRPPEAATPLPEPPRGLVPGADPAYVRQGQPIELRWTGVLPSSRVEVLDLQKDEVLLARDGGAPPLRLELPWLGTFRWRVSARDARGLESRPSSTGYVCSVDR